MTDMNSDLVQQLEDTIDVLQGEGWNRYLFNSNIAAPHCISGAWTRAGLLTGHRIWPAWPGELFASITGQGRLTWNDQYARDRHEVIAVLLTIRNIAYREAQQQGGLTEGVDW